MTDTGSDRRTDVAVAGLSCVDCVAKSRGETQWHVMNPVANVRLRSGGIGNAVSAVSGLGLKLSVSTRVGEDVHARYLLDRWLEMGVDVSAVTTDPHLPTGFSFVLDHGDERTPFFASGANDAFGLDDIPESFYKTARCMLLFFAGALPSLDGEPMLELAKQCRKAGTAVILDVIDGVEADYSTLRSCLPYVNLLINTEESRRITGMASPVDALKVLDNMAGDDHMFRGVTRGDGVVFSILGNNGRKYVDMRSPFYGWPVANVVGAGDAFRAGLAAYICLHYEEFQSTTMDFEEAGLFASAVSYSYLSRTSDVRPFSLGDIEKLSPPQSADLNPRSDSRPPRPISM